MDVVLSGVSHTSSVVRKATLSCLIQMSLCPTEIDEELPENAERKPSLELITTAVVSLLQDEDKDISKDALEFTTQEREDPFNALFMELLQKTPSAIPSMLRRLGTKAINHVGIPAEYALLKIHETDNGKELIRAGFSRLWEDENVSAEEKMRVVSGLADSFDDLRKTAYKGGLVSAMFKLFESDHATEAMVSLL